MRSISTLFKKFLKNKSGNVGGIFAVSSIALLGAGGMAVDYSRTMTVQNKLQVVADATALAAAHQSDLDDGELQEFGEKWFYANGGRSVDAQDIKFKIVREGSGIIVDVVSEVPTSITGIIGIESLAGKAHSEVLIGASSKPIELVIAMDTTASMGFGGNWTRAKTALADMAKSLKNASGKKEFAVTLLPFGDRVNVGHSRGKTWSGVSSPLSGYRGCLEPRHEKKAANEFVLTDKTPKQLSFDPSAVGYFGPIYNGYSAPRCPKEIVGPTNDINEIATGLDSVYPSGTGRFDIAVAWAWRLLSPKWQGLWGAKDYPTKDEETKKVAVFVSDGHTFAYEYEVYKNGARAPWGRNNGTPLGFRNFSDVCKDMKDEGTEIHTLFLRGNKNFIPYMKKCATSKNHYHDISSFKDFKLALGKVGEVSGGSIRLTK